MGELSKGTVMRKIILSASLGVVLASVAPAFAQLSYTSANRTAVARLSAGGPGPLDTQMNNALGDADFTASVVLEPPFPGSASSHQVSLLAPTFASVRGDFTLNRPAAAGTGAAFGSSIFDITFTVAAPTAFSLAGNVPEPAFRDPRYISPNRFVRLTGPGVSINLDGPNTFARAGQFAPGTYNLRVDVEAWSVGGALPFEGIPGFEVILSVPTPGGTMLGLAGVGLIARRRRRA